MGFPKYDGCCTITAAELNYMFDPYDIKASILENGVNVTKLMYSESLTDIDHDYMVVDVFTDTSGYNNTIQLNTFNCACANTCATEISKMCCLICFSNGMPAYTVTYGASGNNVSSCIIVYNTGNPSYYGAEFCVNACGQLGIENISLNNYDKISFCIVKCLCGLGAYNVGSCGCYIITNAMNTTSETKCFVSTNNCQVYNCSIVDCYCFIRTTDNCFDVFCNSFYINNLNLINSSDIPVFCIYTYARNVRDSWTTYATAKVCLINFIACKDLTTTSTYCSSALNGYYINNCNGNFLVCPCGLITASCAYYGCYFAYGRAAVSGGVTVCSCVLSTSENILNVNEFGFKINYCGIYNNGGCGCACGSYTLCSCNWDDNFCYASPCCCASNNYSSTRCYKYVCVSTNCYDFYCNGSCKCQVTLNSFPNIIFHNVGSGNYYSGGYFFVSACLYDTYTCSLNNLCISTVPICWSSPIKSIYYADEKIGSGSRVYNVIDASNGCCIACNLLPNITYSLCDSVCCHRYEIIQCNDGISCIKSYAILAGHA